MTWGQPTPVRRERTASRPAVLLLAFALFLPGLACAQLLAPVRFDHGDSTVIAGVREQLKQGEAAEADQRARRWIGEMEKKYGRESLEVAGAIALVIETSWSTGQQTGDEAMRLAERQREIRAALLGREHGDYAASVYTIGNLYLARGDYETADSLLTQSLALREKALGVDHPLVGGTHARMAYIKRLRNRFDEAVTHAQRSLEIAEKAKGPTSVDVGIALTSLGNTYISMGRYPDARTTAERGHTIWIANYPPDSPQVVNSLHNLSWISYNLGDYRQARAYAEPALRVRETTLKDDAPSLINLLSNTAAVDYALGDYDLAAERYERMLALSRETLGDDHPDFFQSENNVATFYKTRGELEKALPLLLDVKERGRAVLGEDHLEYAHNLEVLGELYLDTGDLPRAEEVLSEALRLDRKNLGEDHPYVAGLLDLLAETRKTMGHAEEARGLMEQALKIKEAAAGMESPELCAILSDLAGAQALTGDHAGARRTLERSQAIQEKSVGVETARLAETLILLSRLDRAEQRAPAAEEKLTRALAIRERIFGMASPLVGSAAAELAQLHFSLGNDAAALAEALRAERIGRDHLRVMADVFSEEELLRYAPLRPTGKDVLLSLLAENGKRLPRDAARQVWDELLLSRAVVLDALAERQRALAASADTSIARLSDQLRRATARHAHLLVSGDTEQPGFHADIETARAERDAARQALAAASPDFRDRAARESVDLAAVTARLPESAALAAYWEFDRLPRGAESPATPSFLALVLPADHREPRVVSLGPTAAIDAEVARWRGALAPGSRAEDALESGLALRRLVWDPVESRAGACRLLLLVPDGSLQLVSWLGLPMSKDRYLAEEERIVHPLVTERDLLTDASESNGGLLALGGIDFDAADAPASGMATPPREGWANVIGRLFRGGSPDCPEFRDARFTALPGSGHEVDAIVALWSAASRDRAAEERRGGSATETRFKQDVAGKSVLHLATHGFFLSGGCAVTNPGRRGIGQLGAPAPKHDDLAGPAGASDLPDLRLSGLALAGANQRAAASTGDDGILTAEEIAALDLSATDWAVLSACDTGLGEVTRGEGILGLRRAFQLAGVRTVLMSLWPVEDDAAREWMVALYRARWAEGLGTAAAVRAACLERLAALRSAGAPTSPADWAGFVAAGDWR